MKYKLTFWQRFWLPFTWLGWWMCTDTNKKTWHEVKKGMEPHEHKFTIPHEGRFLMCEHEGCYLCDFPGGVDPIIKEMEDRVRAAYEIYNEPFPEEIYAK